MTNTVLTQIMQTNFGDIPKMLTDKKHCIKPANNCGEEILCPIIKTSNDYERLREFHPIITTRLKPPPSMDGTMMKMEHYIQSTCHLVCLLFLRTFFNSTMWWGTNVDVLQIILVDVWWHRCHAQYCIVVALVWISIQWQGSLTKTMKAILDGKVC